MNIVSDVVGSQEVETRYLVEDQDQDEPWTQERKTDTRLSVRGVWTHRSGTDN